MAQFKIVNGPSKFDLMLSLFEGKKVAFELEPCPKGGVVVRWEFFISSIQREDGSSESWNIKASVAGASWQVTKRMYFETRRRSGHVEF